jgi:type IV pilus assembly protein PilV
MSEKLMQREQNAMLNNEQGFSLIEFLVAIVILTVGMLGMLQAINVALDRNLESMFRNESSVLADDRMMLMRNRSFASISTTSANPAKKFVRRDVRGIFNNYSVQEIVNPTTALSKEIIINVSWRKKNKQYSNSISSVVSTFPQ